MSLDIEKKIAELGLTLPEAAKPVANYVACVQTGSLLIISGQLPLEAGALKAKGKLGGEVSDEIGIACAQACFLNVVAQAKAALGDLKRVKKVVRLGGFISCAPAFTNHAKIMNGASDLAVGLFGERGIHARSTIGVPSLPLDAPVEVEAIFEIAP
ncbi:YjgF-endoribonc domain-containing protein [Acetobacteraceae bacterium EV16G]|uniref:YjgF-endoribonc domain-containing protein n=1 Tax=Sorlinia euscelidii TaxID=3081148 RepID=A0ABU7TYP5_9PROT